MSTKGEVLYHPVNATQEQTWLGWSWPAFFFGIFWLMAKNLWGHFAINLGLVIISGGVLAPFVWIAYGAIGNEQHRKSLLSKGYLTSEQMLAAKAARMPAAAASPVPVPAKKDSIQHLQELAGLRDRGILTEDEFQAQKAKVLSA